MVQGKAIAVRQTCGLCSGGGGGERRRRRRERLRRLSVAKKRPTKTSPQIRELKLLQYMFAVGVVVVGEAAKRAR